PVWHIAPSYDDPEFHVHFHGVHGEVGGRYECRLLVGDGALDMQVADLSEGGLLSQFDGPLVHPHSFGQHSTKTLQRIPSLGLVSVGAVEFENEVHGYSSSNRIAKFLDEFGHLI